MAIGLLYISTTGQIQSLLAATSLEAILRQVPPAGQALLADDGPMDRMTLDRWRVVGGALLEKTQTILTATPNPFAADGVTECVVTLDPFAPCTLLVSGVAYTLTDEDPTLVLTSETAATFVVSLEWHPLSWADPLTIIAEEP